MAVALCAAPVAGAHSATPNAKPKAVSIAFVVADQAVAFYDTMHCGAIAAAKSQNVKLNWQGPATPDFQAELTTLSAVMQLHPQGLVVAPFDPNAFISPVQNAMKSGVPVVTVDGSLAKKVELQNIRTNNLKAGAQAADQVATFTNKKGLVLVIGLQPGVTANQQRITGFANRIKAKYPKIKLLPYEYANGDSNIADQQTAAVITAHPNLAAVYTTNNAGGEGAASAILAKGKRGKIRLISYDADPVQVAGLKNHTYDALVVQNPYAEGQQSVTLVAKVIRKQIKVKSIKYQNYPVSFIATRKNINNKSLQKYLYHVNCV